MKKNHFLIYMLAASTLLMACDKSASRTLGLSKNTPDEFLVAPHQPLSVPPDFALRAPTDGKSADSKKSGDELLGAKKPAPSAPAAPTVTDKGESSLLQKAGASPNDEKAREQLSNEELEEKKPAEEKTSGGFFSWFSPAKPATPDPVVDAAKEKKRIDDNLAADKPATEGQPVTAPPKQGGMLSRLWDSIF